MTAQKRSGKPRALSSAIRGKAAMLRRLELAERIDPATDLMLRAKRLPGNADILELAGLSAAEYWHPENSKGESAGGELATACTKGRSARWP